MKSVGKNKGYLLLVSIILLSLVSGIFYIVLDIFNRDIKESNLKRINLEKEWKLENIFMLGESYLYEMNEKIVSGEIESEEDYFFGNYINLKENKGKYKIKKIWINGLLKKDLILEINKDNLVKIMMKKSLFIEREFELNVCQEIFYEKDNLDLSKPNKKNNVELMIVEKNNKSIGE
ncbi:hypothetical protein SAMN02745174_02336 [Cetobacterium ceti]|uniref:Uncharacterized protein n=1 Tax=Cetobacterium ceti TaxID=180163 RepID=A0A1T4QIF8_9FUSO|nr:hypothetical protein [Cetobacterium ceti]SKA03484.1 hypothetical protein SAMN02745174_02336 [Cetobacterium ceti]